jgi:pimeloyl-ACP methyl ester carboxylesterase
MVRMMAAPGSRGGGEASKERPNVILVHGAANSAAVWRYWQQELAHFGWSSHAIDLPGHGAGRSVDLANTGMHAYADDVADLATRYSPKPIVIGWSMGGLVAMMVAARGLASACVGLAPSAPMLRQDDTVVLRHGVFGPEEYGIVTRDLERQPMMADLDAEERTIALGSLGAESRLARDERKRGIVVTSLPCPLLIVTGDRDTDWPRAKYASLHLPAEYLTLEGCSHWGLVLNRRALTRMVPLVCQWMVQAARA